MDLSTSATMQIRFTADERCLRHVRLSIVSFLMVMAEDRDLASRVAMTAAELVENAVKYTSQNPIRFNLTATSEPEAWEVKVETRNAASPEQMAELKRVFETVSKGEGLDAYMTALREVPDKREGQSQLGLARIRYEGQMQLGCTLEGDNVVMSAHTRVTRK